jgi:hypothetical protein
VLAFRLGSAGPYYKLLIARCVINWAVSYNFIMYLVVLVMLLVTSEVGLTYARWAFQHYFRSKSTLTTYSDNLILMLITISMFHYHVPLRMSAKRNSTQSWHKRKVKRIFLFEQSSREQRNRGGPWFVVSERGTIHIAFPMTLEEDSMASSSSNPL